MSSNPIYILTVLVFIEACILCLSGSSRTGRYFKYLPSMFWIYFLPMLAGTLHIIPNKSPVYDAITIWCLPASLVLLLLSVDIKAILHLGGTALAMMAFGAAGIMLGGPVVVFLYKSWLPQNAWMGIGSLSASWIGGSANMIAVKEAIGTPDDVFLPAVIVDTLVPYLWMGILITLSAYQIWFDKCNRSRTRLLDELYLRTKKSADTELESSVALHFPVLLGIGAAGAAISFNFANQLPHVPGFVNTTAWAILIATFFGIALSFTPVRLLESDGSSRLGFVLLYFVLASIGAKASLANFAAAPVLLVAGITWIIIHGIFLLIGARLLRAPMALAAAASQACVGGTASAPVVAGIYRPQLAPVGLLLAVLGNIFGTFLGLCTSRLCFWANSFHW